MDKHDDLGVNWWSSYWRGDLTPDWVDMDLAINHPKDTATDRV
tara:strand:- start:4220 stop:4348 length:129 start_codon:yes stop_codon:yes gene_type:complete